MLLDFVDGMKSHLTAMDEKLDALGSAMGAMHADVVRLAGRPVLEVYNEWSKRTKIAAESVLPSEGTCRSSLTIRTLYGNHRYQCREIRLGHNRNISKYFT